MQRSEASARRFLSRALTGLQRQEGLKGCNLKDLPVEDLGDAEVHSWVHALLGNPVVWKFLMAGKVDGDTATLLMDCGLMANWYSKTMPQTLVEFLTLLDCFSEAGKYGRFVVAMANKKIALCLPLLVNFMAESLAYIKANEHCGFDGIWPSIYEVAMLEFRSLFSSAVAAGSAVCKLVSIDVPQVMTRVVASLFPLQQQHESLPERWNAVAWEVAMVGFQEEVLAVMDWPCEHGRQYVMSGFFTLVQWAQRPLLLAELCKADLHPCLAHRSPTNPTLLAFCNWYKHRPNPAHLLHVLTACRAWEPLVWSMGALQLTVLYIVKHGAKVVVSNPQYFHWMLGILTSAAKETCAPGIARAMDDALVALAKAAGRVPEAAADLAKIVGPAVFGCMGPRHAALCIVTGAPCLLPDVCAAGLPVPFLEEVLTMPAFASMFLYWHWVEGAAPASIVACLLPDTGIELCKPGDETKVEAVLDIAKHVAVKWCSTVEPQTVRQFVLNMFKAMEQPVKDWADNVHTMLSVITVFLICTQPQPIAVPLVETEALLTILKQRESGFVPIIQQALSRRVVEDPLSVDWDALAGMVVKCSQDLADGVFMLMAASIGLRADVVMDQFAGHVAAQGMWVKWLLDQWPFYGDEKMQASVMHFVRRYPEQMLGHPAAHRSLETFVANPLSCEALTLCACVMDTRWLACLQKRLAKSPRSPALDAVRDAVAAAAAAASPAHV